MQIKITINLPDEDETLASTAVVRQSHILLYRSLAVHEPTVVFVRPGRSPVGRNRCGFAARRAAGFCLVR